MRFKLALSIMLIGSLAKGQSNGLSAGSSSDVNILSELDVSLFHDNERNALYPFQRNTTSPLNFQKKERKKRVRKEKFKRKGFHAGSHFFIGSGNSGGAYLNFENINGLPGPPTSLFAEESSTFELGGDILYYFNRTIGVKTGLYWSQLNGKTDNYYKSSYSTSGFKTPFKFVITTGNKIGFYFDIGVELYMPTSSKAMLYDYELDDLQISPTVLGTSTNIGLNYTIGSYTSINATFTINDGIDDYYSISKEIADLSIATIKQWHAVGFQISISRKL